MSEIKNSLYSVKIIVIPLVFFLFMGCDNNQPDVNTLKGREVSPIKPTATNYPDKKVIFINSYHQGYVWSDDIEQSVKKIFEKTNIDLKTVRMDTKRNTDIEYIKNKTKEVKNIIDEFDPDVIITSDDNAFKYVIMPYYRDTNLPVVFCGLNWDVSIYDAPYKNTTGMIEVAVIPRLMEYLLLYAKGEKIGYIAADVLTARKEGFYYKSIFNLDIHELYVKTFQEWKEGFIEIQDQVDALIVGNNAGINDWDENDAEIFMETNTRIPTGAIYEWMTPYVLVSLTKDAGEQGEWAAETALEILAGRPVNDIPLVKNKRGNLYLNLKLAEQLSIVFDPILLKNADIIR